MGILRKPGNQTAHKAEHYQDKTEKLIAHYLQMRPPNKKGAYSLKETTTASIKLY